MKYWPSREQWIPVMIIVLVTLILVRLVFSRVPFIGPLITGSPMAAKTAADPSAV